MGWMRSTRGTTAIHRQRAFAVAALAALLLAGCTAGTPPEPGAAPAPTTASPSAEAADGVTDPLAIVTTPGTGAFIAEDVQAALHEGGTGPATFEVPQPESTVGSLQFFVTCATGEYRILVGGVFVYGSGCSPTTANSAAMPIPQRDTPLTVTVEVPEGVAFRILAVPV